MAAGVSTGSSGLDWLVAVAVALGALTTISTAIAKVRPLRAMVRFVFGRIVGPAWRAVVVEPIRSWFQGELREGMRPIVEHSVKRNVSEAVERALPGAVRRAVRDTVEPAIDKVRTELREHMAIEEAHAASEEEWRTDVRQALLDAHVRIGDATDELRGVKDQVSALEDRIPANGFEATTTVKLSPSPPPAAPQE